MQNLNTTSAINDMLQMQSTLNNATNGPDWRSGVTQLGKTINWQRCIYMETAELIDSYPWKHWKSVDAKVDEENARVELVDIWHFLLSLALEHLALDQATGLLEKALQSNKGSQADIASEISVMEQITAHETMMRVALESIEDAEDYLLRLTQSFFNACKVADLSFDQLYQIYMAKNVLNKFRQDNGYKEGSYIKEWNGKEDNVVMFEIIAQMQSFSGETLYQQLEVQYSRIA